MKHTLLFLLVASSFYSFSQEFKEVELKTEIKEVTVFLQGAQISRKGEVDIPVGKSIVRVKSLSPYIDEKSVQVKANGDFTVLSVNHKSDYLSELDKGEEIDSIQNLIEKIETELAVYTNRLQVLEEKVSLLNQNKVLGGLNTGTSLSQLKEAMVFYDQELSKIKKEELEIYEAKEELAEHKRRLESQISEVANRKEDPTGQIEIRIDAKVKSKGKFHMTYMVDNAGWYANYDIRVKDVNSPVSLNYKADVYQNTGVDWNNVKLKFSNGTPNQSGLAPKLKTWNLNYARYSVYERAENNILSALSGTVSGRIVDETGSPLPGATILIKGTSIGTVTDIDGNYSLTLPHGASNLVVSFIGYMTQEIPINSSVINRSMEVDVQQLEEVVVTGYSSTGRSGRSYGYGLRTIPNYRAKADKIITTVVENQTTVEFEVPVPYSIKSNGQKLTVDLRKMEVDANYQYYAVPKLDKDAFLVARIVNWDKYNLLEGEANLFFEDAYVGRTILDAKSLSDTLDISLGRDKSIVIARKKVDEFTRNKSLGSNRLEARAFEIMVRNKKSQRIQLSLFDQIPVSVINTITVVPGALTGGALDEDRGIITWDMSLEAQEQKDLKFEYEVRFPKREEVLLE